MAIEMIDLNALGKIAYESHAKIFISKPDDYFKTEEPPKWDNLDNHAKLHWINIAKAVARAVYDNIVYGK